MPLTDPLFYVLAIPAVLIAGISKGGFGGGLVVVAVPLLSLAVPPPQAAAILLPILCLMDAQSLWAYRGRWDNNQLRILLPAALIGIAVGTVSFSYLDTQAIRLLLGVIAVSFVLNYWFGQRAKSPDTEAKSNAIKGGFWSAIAGFTSFVAHAGGPPLTMYLLSQRLEKTVYQATTVIFFASLNIVKLVPYFWLGQFSQTNLLTALALAPLTLLGVGLGIWLHNKVPVALFYRFCYGFLFLTGLKLLYDGLQPWL